jgi:peptide/nickel transport system permease protein
VVTNETPSALKDVSAAPSLLRSLTRTPLGALGLLFVLLFVLLAVFAPLLARHDPNAIVLQARLNGPSWQHWFGTDDLGRDIFARVVFGARISMTVAVCVVGISLTLGLVLGSLAGYYGRWTDRILNTLLMNAFLALPGILLAIAFVAFLGPGLFNLILALSISGWVGYARLVRAQVLAAREKEYVESARALGAGDLRILRVHILPNIVQPVLVQAALGMGGAVLAEATLSFLGLGVTAPMASWGSMLNDARSHLFDAPHLIVFPAVAVALCILSFNFVADALRDRLDPRTRLTMGL